MSETFHAFAVLTGFGIGVVAYVITAFHCKNPQDRLQHPIVYGLFTASLSAAILYMVGYAIG